MSIRERLSGNEAVAYAMKQINPDVMGAYPITPSTEIPQYFSAYVDNGEVDTDQGEDPDISVSGWSDVASYMDEHMG